MGLGSCILYSPGKYSRITAFANTNDIHEFPLQSFTASLAHRYLATGDPHPLLCPLHHRRDHTTRPTLPSPCTRAALAVQATGGPEVPTHWRVFSFLFLRLFAHSRYFTRLSRSLTARALSESLSLPPFFRPPSFAIRTHAHIHARSPRLPLFTPALTPSRSPSRRPRSCSPSFAPVLAPSLSPPSLPVLRFAALRLAPSRSRPLSRPLSLPRLRPRSRLCWEKENAGFIGR